MRARARRLDGSAIVMVATSLVMLFCAAGLTVDLGYWYHTAAQLQTAADAAALAGCRFLPDRGAADGEARRCAGWNACTGSDVWLVRPLPEDAVAPTRLEVVLSRRVAPWFLAALGVRPFDVRARAVAERSSNPDEGTASGGPATRYAVYAGREFSPPGYTNPDQTKFSTNGLTVNGAVHTNGELAVTGSGNRFNGPVTAGHDISGGHDTVFTGTSPNAPRVPMPAVDLAGLEQAARSEGHYYQFEKRGQTWTVYDPASASMVPALPPPGAQFSGSTLHFVASTATVAGTYYVANGGVHVDGSQLDGQATFVADGPVKLNGSDLSWTDDAGVAFVSLSNGKDAIDISGSDSTFDALLYAPNGTVKLAGNGLTLNGSVIANNITQNIAGSSITINYDPAIAGLLPLTAASDVYLVLVD